jgi:hypothetical protein
MSASASASASGVRLVMVVIGGNRGHRRDAYDTLNSVTCAALRPSEKYHRRPACAAE